TGKVSSAYTEAKSCAVKERPDQQLWLGVPTAYPGHHPGSSLLADLFPCGSHPRHQEEALRLSTSALTACVNNVPRGSSFPATWSCADTISIGTFNARSAELASLNF